MLSLQICISLLLAPLLGFAQNSPAAVPDAEGYFEVAATNLKPLKSSPRLRFPPELSAREVIDQVVATVTIAPDGTVKATRIVSGKYKELKESVEGTVQRWAFEPYLVNGTPVPVRTKLTFNFDNTLEHYRGPNGEVPVHLDEKTFSAFEIKKIAPIYPEHARSDHVQGSVELRLIVGKDGQLQFLHIIRGSAVLAPAAYEAVRQWQFKPYVENGQAVPVITTVIVNFVLGSYGGI
jgi:TonB family protein